MTASRVAVTHPRADVPGAAELHGSFQIGRQRRAFVGDRRTWPRSASGLGVHRLVGGVGDVGIVATASERTLPLRCWLVHPDSSA